METMVRKEELLEQRVGNLEEKVDEGFARVDTDVRELRGEVRGLDEKLTGKLDAHGKEVPGELKKLDEKLTGKIEALHEKFMGNIEALDEKLTGKIEALDEKLTEKIDRMTVGLVLAVVGTALVDRLL